MDACSRQAANGLLEVSTPLLSPRQGESVLLEQNTLRSCLGVEYATDYAHAVWLNKACREYYLMRIIFLLPSG